ncbi:MAG: PorV/PorQ family protein [Bacteroidota bacterium]
MKNFTYKAALVISLLGISMQGFAGNKDRSGQAGATELLINPWAQGTGVFGMNTSYVSGIEAMKSNIAGLAFVNKTEVGVTYSDYLSGSNIGVSDLAIAQKVGDVGVIGINVMSMNFGDIDITNYNNPTGGVGTYNPQFYNITFGFAKEFSNSIYAGVATTLVQEQLANISASGACFEAGIQYITGKRNNFHFGITLRNVGTNMRFSGDGFSGGFDNTNNTNASYTIARNTPSEKFEMPTYLNMGLSYDFYLDEGHAKGDSVKPNHRLTVMGNFTSNSFNNDYIGGGLEYSFMNMFMVRGAYRYENNINDPALATTFYTGFACGATIQKRMGEKGPILAVDYSYRPTQHPANGVHTFSLRLMR